MTRNTLQHKLDQVRAPRVHITYDAEIGDAIELKEIPFVVGVLGDFSGKPDEPLPKLKDRKFIEFDLDNFNAILGAVKPGLEFTVDDLLSGEDSKLTVTLSFRHVNDFEPAQVIGQVKPLAELLERRQQLESCKTLVNKYGTELANSDSQISRQLNRILHAPEFQKLEASWRGLHYLVSQTQTSERLKIRVLNVSKHDLVKDFQRAPDFDQTHLFKKVYEEAYGTFGSAPFGALIGDYEFGRHPQDIELLVKLSEVAAAAHAPFIAAASPQLFNLGSFTELDSPRDLAKIFHTVEYAKWNSFRDSEASRFVGLTVPRILMRLPYTLRPTPNPTFQFIEELDDSGRLFLWGNAAYAFGACLTNAFAKYQWCAKIRGIEGGGLVEGLPSRTFKTDKGEVALKCSTEIALTDRREKELADLGFIPLVTSKGTDYAVFFSASSCQRPRIYDSDSANANARLATQLQCIMTTSRFAHYLKVMTRDMGRHFETRGDYERFLNQWITNYCLLDDDPSPETKARYPLREAMVDVSEVPGKPGVYKAVVYLRPHFQLDELTVSLRLVIELPQSAGF